ncbi:hypothetical protein HDV00_011840 [Rhizophlyctis rosea]|nr:hypothetical protein HDV00_011840 [Rhizophlyctis rosea]
MAEKLLHKLVKAGWLDNLDIHHEERERGAVYECGRNIRNRPTGEDETNLMVDLLYGGCKHCFYDWI